MRDDHLSDQELVLAADGELSPHRERHLAGCPSCRARRLELKRGDSLPPAGPARARLSLRLVEVAEQPKARPFWPGPWRMAFASGLALIGAWAVLTFRRSQRAGACEVPSSRLTPGAA